MTGHLRNVATRSVKRKKLEGQVKGMTIIDGKQIAQSIQAEIKEFVKNCRGRKPSLAVILVGKDPPSKIYIRRKTKACEESGIRSIKIELPMETPENELLAAIHRLNNDPEIDGILVQLPLPKHISASTITSTIDPDKDVDGFHPINVGKMLMGETTGFLPCTPLGISTLLERYDVEVRGKHAVIIGRSNIVGKPMSVLLMQNNRSGNATVTVVHRHTKNLKELCKMADLIIVAIGKPKFITTEPLAKLFGLFSRPFFASLRARSCKPRVVGCELRPLRGEKIS